MTRAAMTPSRSCGRTSAPTSSRCSRSRRRSRTATPPGPSRGCTPLAWTSVSRCCLQEKLWKQFSESCSKQSTWEEVGEKSTKLLPKQIHDELILPLRQHRVEEGGAAPLAPQGARRMADARGSNLGRGQLQVRSQNFTFQSSM